MMEVYVNKDRYQYDIHALVKAFFPEEEVKMTTQLPERGFINIRFLDDIKRIHIDISLDAQRTLSDDIAYTEPPADDADQKSSDASTNGTEASKSTQKNALKQLLYGLLVKTTGRELPWGALTGIRPAKIAYHLLEQNEDDKKIRNYLKNVYFVSDKKIDLSLRIAKTEKSVLDLYPYRSGYSLYAGIPFCPTRCGYCSFAAVPVAAFKDRVPLYLDCLKRELAGTARLMAGKRLDTVYIGGGTPTSLTAAQLDELIFYIESVFDMREVKEFTVEAGRPDSILDDPLKLRRLKEHKVNRICVNPQTFVQRTLDVIGRGHSVYQTEEAFYLARSEGFDNINMDIIVGLPGEGIADMRTTADHLLRLRPDDLTIHSLAVKRGSALKARLSEAREQIKIGKNNEDVLLSLNPVKSDVRSISDITKMMEIAENCAEEMELIPYYLYRQKNMTGNMENTGYAREGCFGLTNILGMEEVHSILAVGAGAVTKRVYEGSQGLITRCGNVRDINQYMARVEEMIARKEKLFLTGNQYEC